MARFLTLAAIAIVFEIVATIELNSTVALNSLRDPKHRSELVDEAFLEQKDVLLEMLEAKLKEVRAKKKKKKSLDHSDLKLCDTLSKDKTLVMKANGISNVGIMNLLMNHGASGRGHLNLDADGISNVGRAHLELGMEGGVNVPGISNSLVAAPPSFNSIFCGKEEPKEAKTEPNSPNVSLKRILDETDANIKESNANSIATVTKATDIAPKAPVLIAKAADTTNDATATVANVTDTVANVTATGANAIDTATTAITNEMDSNDIDVSNITASAANIALTASNSRATESVPETIVTLPSNINTVAK